MNERLTAELKNLGDMAEGGLLLPKSVVEWARAHPDSELHKEFEWEDKKAADAHRLEQARSLIRGYIIVVPNNPVPVRGYISIATDRASSGGYRRTGDALASSPYRQQMVEDVLKRLEQMRQNSSLLPELAGLLAKIAAEVAAFRVSQVRPADSEGAA